MQSQAGLYIHIPFCQRKCEYCDFYSITRLEEMEAFVEALLTEIRLRAPEFAGVRFATVFFGGGTPSLLGEAQLERIWAALHRHFDIDPGGEFTLEANPGTLTPEKLRFLKSLGLNRLSLGVQSFHEHELAFLGRIHTVEEVIANVGHAREAGFDNINLDLMTAFPGITEASFRSSLARAVALQPEHLSCYTLIFEPGTVLYKRMRRGEVQPLSEEEEARYYNIARQVLEGEGYEQYEISNFARGKAHVCRHNLIYWTHAPYLGLGPSAHSFFRHQRLANRRSLTAYINLLRRGELPVEFVETLSAEQLQFEYIFLRLRLREGIDLEDYRRRFGRELPQQYAGILHRLQEQQLVQLTDRTLRLTDRGWLLADAVATWF
ncbi:MAG: radical SAM family heme chaperone HemW [Calditrichaeota bacterium]|nr:MAG: radical SAM family heme chaperone HemW [Calditrichota bacterium]